MSRPRATTVSGRATRAPRWRTVAALGLLLSSALSGNSYGAAAGFEGLAGYYVGESISESTAGLSAALADLHIDVRARGDGFVLRWQSLTKLTDDPTRHHEIVFIKTRRAGIYLSGMRCSTFGQPRPLDPARGEPYVWAHLAGDELTVYAMSIADDGSHDLSQYRYRRDGDRLVLAFERTRAGAEVERLAATLVRSVPDESTAARVVAHHAGANCG